MGDALPGSHPGHLAVAALTTAVTARSHRWGRLVLALAVRAVVSPSLARDLVRVAWRFRARRWFLRPPFLPVPAAGYTRWRMYTAYGDERAVPPVEAVVRYARWAGRR